MGHLIRLLRSLAFCVWCLHCTPFCGPFDHPHSVYSVAIAFVLSAVTRLCSLHSPFAWCNVCELNGRLAVVCLPFFFYSVCVCVGLIFIGRSELAQFSTIHNFHRAIEQLHMLILISNQSSLCRSVYLPATGTPCCHCTTYDLDTAAVWGTRRFKNETDTIQIGSQHR